MGQRSGHVDDFTARHLPPRDEWPDFLFDLPELQFPARLNCAERLLAAAQDPARADRTAVIDAVRRLSYRELEHMASQFAAQLVGDMGLVSGNRVLLRSANNAVLAAAWLGVMKAGGVAVTTMAMLRSKELQTIVDKAQVSHVLCDRRLAAELDAVRPANGAALRRFVFDAEAADAGLGAAPGEFAAVDTAADDTALLAFTSGTTGQPKATMHFHRDVLAMADIVGGRLLQTRADDVYIGSPPLGFTFGLGASLVFPLRFGAAVVLVEAPTPDALLAGIREHGATGLFTAPAMYRAILKNLAQAGSTAAIASLRLCVSAGEALPAPTSDAWHAATGLRIVDGIGATEMMHIFISANGADIRPGSTGKPLPGYVACVLDDEGRPQQRGIGRLAVKGPTGCRYLDDPRQRDYVVDGWNVTGDVYEIDADGYYWFRARADDIILSSGYNIAGPEVESALLAHAAVSECAVIGVPDEERGHIVKAYVVVADGRSADDALAAELQAHVKATIAPYKYPRAIEFVAELPKTQTGKIQRFRLRSGAER